MARGSFHLTLDSDTKGIWGFWLEVSTYLVLNKEEECHKSCCAFSNELKWRFGFAPTEYAAVVDMGVS